jgi:hypothetical protein
MKPNFINRLVRILMLMLLIFVLRRVPGRFVFLLLEGGGIILIVTGLLYGWHRLSKLFQRRSRQSISSTSK